MSNEQKKQAPPPPPPEPQWPATRDIYEDARPKPGDPRPDFSIIMEDDE